MADTRHHHHHRHHQNRHGQVEPGRQAAPAEERTRKVFLAVLAAAIFFLFIVLPFWLLYKRTANPPTESSFGPAETSHDWKAPATPSQPRRDNDVRFN